MGIANLFRSTADHLRGMRAREPAEPAPIEKPSHELPEINVSADFTRRIIRIDVGGVCDFTLDQKTAIALAKQIDGAADALGPEPPPVSDGEIDLAVEVEDGDG